MTGDKILNDLRRSFDCQARTDGTARLPGAAMPIGQSESQRRADSGFRPPIDCVLVWQSAPLVDGAANAPANYLPSGRGPFGRHGEFEELQELPTRQLS